jgi:predicted enzyme related to lactoylglutathione lyase
LIDLIADRRGVLAGDPRNEHGPLPEILLGWEFVVPEISMMPKGGYAMFSKPGTKLAGGIHLVTEENMIKPKVEPGRAQVTNKFTINVEEVTATLENIKKAGGVILR